MSSPWSVHLRAVVADGSRAGEGQCFGQTLLLRPVIISPANASPANASEPGSGTWLSSTRIELAATSPLLPTSPM